MNAFSESTKKSLQFISNVHLALSETLTKVTSHRVFPTEPKCVNFRNVLDTEKRDIAGVLKMAFTDEHNKWTAAAGECTSDKEMFSLELFYRLLRTRDSDTGRPLLVDVFSNRNKDSYGWVSFSCTNLPPLPFKKLELYGTQPVCIFGTNFL